MLDIKIDELTVNNMMEKAIQEKIDELANEKYFLTYKELSDYLNISKPIIDDRFVKNGLNYYKIGKKYLFKKKEVEEYLDNITAQMDLKNNDFMYFKNNRIEVKS
ncbi:excisionase family DNA-binding protein [Virgibacillus sp. DJP39]|uniref:excisionase family DNA-binding protein n=1 Tax=Virgibacillus sp. DJP39 TaxID=3409790 RepID=UPI003BB66A66